MESIGISFAAVMLLLAANAFFVAAEFALVKARGVRLRTQADAGNGAARLSLRMKDEIEPYLAACQLGITMASLGLGWIGEPAVAALLEPVLSVWSLSDEAVHQIAFVVGFLAFSSLHIVIGEQVPKSMAIRQSEPMSMLAAYPLRGFYILAYPLTWALDRASQGVLRLFRVEEGTHAEVLTLGELKGVVERSEAHGNIPTDRAEMIRNLIEFDERPVSWVMVPRNRVTVLSLAVSPEENLATMRSSGFSRLPVVESRSGDDVMGVVLVKDIYRAMLQGESDPWIDLAGYCREPLVIPERQTVARAFEIMRTHREHLAIVVDEYGQCVGIVSLEDLLEEIVGEIRDETDEAEREYLLEDLGADRWLVDGLMPLSDAQRMLGIAADFGLEANTLSGLVIERLGRIPNPGESIREGEFELVVKAIRDRQIAELLVERRGEEQTTV